MQFRLFLPLMLFIFSSFAFFSTASAQETGNVSANGAQIRVGKLQRGEMLITALRRERVNPESIRLATVAMSKVFDFRLSRAGDRYEFELAENRRLKRLIYYRDKQIYEANRTASNVYEARYVGLEKKSSVTEEKIPVVEAQPEPAAANIDNLDEPGPAPVPQEAPGPFIVEDPMRADVDTDVPMPVEDPELTDEPVYGDVGIPRPTETDLVLTERISPDETEEVSEADAVPKEIDNAELSDSTAVLRVPQGSGREDKLSSSAAYRAALDKKYADTLFESRILIFSSVIAVVVAFMLLILPSLRRRRLLSSASLRVLEEIRVSENQSILLVKHANGVSIVASDDSGIVPLGDRGEEEARALGDMIRAKSIWTGLSGKTLSKVELTNMTKNGIGDAE